MIEAGLIMLTLVACAAGWHFHNEWLRATRALREWADRWAKAPLLCAVPGCGKPFEDECHVQYPNEEVRAIRGHRFLEARLVPKPQPMVRETIGASR